VRFFPVRHPEPLTSCRRIAATIALLVCLDAGVARALSSPLSAQAGADYGRSVNDQSTRSAFAMGTLEAGWSVSAGILRYDDSQAGAGNGFLGALGLPLAPMASLKAQFVRFIGDESFRAWRARIGPEISLPRGVAAGVSYVHQRDNSGGRSSGVAGEVAIPVTAAVTARANGSFASLANGLDAAAGAVGLGWRPIPLLEFSGEIGIARNGSLMTSTSAPSGGTMLPILGDVGGSPGTTETREGSRTGATFLIGVQTHFP